MADGTLGNVLFLPHGGGPLPILGDPGHGRLVEFLESIGGALVEPKAILVVSAHWEESAPTVGAGASPELIYDYYNFPPESYEITYPASGSPDTAERIVSLLEDNGIDCVSDRDRGFDHGMFIPLKLMYPDAQIPCVQLSLLSDLDAASHIRLGKALSPLLDEEILVIGSGMSYHNMQGFFDKSESSRKENEAFDHWLVETCCDDALSNPAREERLANWASAPAARACHPREEHLLPLHVCFGAAFDQDKPAEPVFSDDVLTKRASAFLW